ncbi:MAG: type II asparaginase [Psychroflexus sp.]|nr:type II asparaginase [Psychroflexus sp.]
MKTLKSFIYLLTLIVSLHMVAQKNDLSNVVILATGGTIAGVGETGAQAGYTSGQVGIETMINSVPGIEKLANLTGEQISNVGSQDMSIKIWLKIANRINELLASEDVDGIVITHGTDTLEETAFFLNLIVKSDKPVVTTGSMRPSTAVSAEGPLNLYNAVAVAAHPDSKGRGTMVVLNDQIHAARAVTKTNTNAVQAFVSPFRGLLGSVIYGQIEFYRKPFGVHSTESIFSVDDISSLPRVDIIYAAADSSADLIDLSIKAGVKGIVIAGVGNGNMNTAMLEACKKAVNQGIVVVRSTRLPSGYVIRNAEVNDDEIGTIASDDLNTAKSRVLLMLCLHETKNAKDIQEIFYNY